MNDLIRTENLLGGNKTIVGSPSADLILESLGKVYIKYGKSIQLLDKVIKGISSSSEESIIITSSNDIEYPGDGKLIYNTTNSLLSICIDGQLVPLIEASGKEGAYVKKSGDRMSGTLYLDNKKPLNVTSTSLIQNLNSEYIGGYKEEDLAKKHEDEIIDGRWTFDELQRFKKKVVIDQSIGTDLYQDGYQGFGWRIDSKSNTLTIDNIIVRKAMYVYELVINKIRATNGSLWITNSATLEEAFRVSDDLNSESWHFSEDKTKIINRSNEYLIHTEDNEKLWTESINYIADYLDYKDKITEFEQSGNYSTYKIYNKFFANSTGYYVIQTDETVFLEGDLLRCQKVINHGIKYYEAVVITTISFDQYLIQLSESSQFYTDVNSDDKLDMFPQKTDIVVQFGNIFNKNRQGSFFITSTEENSPYAMVIADCNRPNYNEPYVSPIFKSDGTLLQVDSKYKYEWIKSVKVRLGKLDKQWDNFYLNEFGESTIKGWGLYGQDVYLTGEFHLNNGQTIVDFAQDGILLKFKNAGLEIKDITPSSTTQNGWKVQMYGKYSGSQKKELDPSSIEFQNGIPAYYTYLGFKYPLHLVNSYYQADCEIDEQNWFIVVNQGESTWNGGSSNKQGIVLTADQVMVVNPKDNKSMSMFTFIDNKAVFNTDLIVTGEIICKNTMDSYYTFNDKGQFQNLYPSTVTNPLWALYDEGHGMLAGGNIRWQKDGQLDIRGTIHATYGDIAGMYLTTIKDYDQYKYFKTDGLILGNGALITNTGIWNDSDGIESSLTIDENGQDTSERLRSMFLNINDTDWEALIRKLKTINYTQEETPATAYYYDNGYYQDYKVGNLMPYDNGLLISQYGIKQKKNKQILSYDSTLLNLTYIPLKLDDDAESIYAADTAYNGYFNGANIGIYNFIVNNIYNTSNVDIIIALDDIADKNTEFMNFLIYGIQQGNIQFKVQSLPIMVLDKTKRYQKISEWGYFSQEDDSPIETTSLEYGKFKWWALQSYNSSNFDVQKNPIQGWYQGYKNDINQYNKFKWNNTDSNRIRYGVPANFVIPIQVIGPPDDAYKNKYPNYNWVTGETNIYGETPYHNLFSGKSLQGSTNYTTLKRFRFKSGAKIVGEQNPYSLNLNTGQFVFNCVYPEAISAKIPNGNVFKDDFAENRIYGRNTNYTALFTGFNKPTGGIIQKDSYTWQLQKRDSNGNYSNYELQDQDLIETIENYIVITTSDDNSVNHSGFSLQIIYNE